MYLSQPAVQAHMRSKHLTSGTESEPVTYMSTNRGRGRPKKIYGKLPRVNPESSEYFKMADKTGGPTDPLFGFEDVLVFVLKAMGKSDVDFSTYPLYESIKKFSFEATPGNPDAIGNLKDIAKNPTSEYYMLNDYKRNWLWWDEVFSIYLWEVSQKVNETFYKEILKYIVCYREWANKIGWDNKFNSSLKQESWQNDSTKDDEDKENTNNTSVQEKKSEISQEINPDILQEAKSNLAAGWTEIQTEYWLLNNAENIPDLCNDFVTVFLEEYSFEISRINAIDMTRNLCSWLYTNGHTGSKLSMA